MTEFGGMDLGSLAEFSALSGTQPEPAGGAPASEPDLAAQVADLSNRLAQSEQRLAETQQWAQRSNAGREMYEGMLAAQQAEAQRQQSAAQNAALYALPELDKDKREELLADPDALYNTIVQVAGVMANRAYGALRPEVDRLSQVAAVTPTLIEDTSIRAYQDVRQELVQNDGVPEEEVDALLQEARSSLWKAAGENEWKFRSYEMNPRALAGAARFQRSMASTGRGGAPLAPSLGGGSNTVSRPNARQTASVDPAIAFEASKIMKGLGVTFTPEEIADVRRR